MNTPKWIIAILLFFAIPATLPAQVIRLATYRYAENDRVKNMQPLAAHLEKLGYRVELKSYPGVHDFIRAIRQNEVDIALINTFGYLLLEAAGKDYPMHPVAALQVREDAKDNYKTAFLASPRVKAGRLEELSTEAAGLRLALVNPGSTSGNLVPRLALSGAGLPEAEKSFAAVSYSQTHVAAIAMLLDGRADVAAMGHTEYEKYLQADSLKNGNLKLLWLSPEIPLGPVLFHNQFGSTMEQDLLNTFLHLKQNNPAALEAIRAGWSEAKQATHFIPIGSTFYDGFKKTLGKEADLQRILQQFVN